MGSLQNHEELVSHGNEKLRTLAADIVTHAIKAASPFSAVQKLVQLEGDILRVDQEVFDLQQYDHVYILGAGKASLQIAQALEDILGDRITDGLFVLKHGCQADLQWARVVHAAHPVPDENGFQAALAMMELADKITEKDFVFAGISGGSSSLLPLPVEGVSLAEKQRVNEILLLSGADITEINAVRKHLSRIKGGWLAKAILPATLVNLTVSDVVGDPLDYITGPTVADTSTFDDAQRVLDRYCLWDDFPESAASYLRLGTDAQETPKDYDNAPLYSYIIVKGAAACLGAAARAEELGFQPLILTTMLKGEAADAGTFFASIANEILRYGRPVSAPCAIIASGENTVTITDQHGRGGPNQEFALSASLDIAGSDAAVIVAIDTDGTDGPTQMAGGMVDGSTVSRAETAGIDIFAELRDHNAGGVLESLDDAIVTGHTGTNVSDLKIVLIE